MKIVSVVFDYCGDKKYSMMAKVLKVSIEKNCPGAEFELIKLPPPRYRTKRCFTSNTVKLAEWSRVMNETNDNVIFIDCDMMVLNDLHSAFNSDFDIGFTKRNKSRIPYNGGVVFVKNTQAARDFIMLWKQINDKMYKDYSFHKPWRDRYAGMNQAAFGCLLETGNHGAKIHKYKTLEWNAVDCDYSSINNKTVFIHYKSKLRKMVLREIAVKQGYEKVVKLWNEMYAMEVPGI